MLRFVFRRICVAAACLLLAVSVLAQETQQPKDQLNDAIKLRTELVVVDAQVVDKRSREFIRGLKPQDFDLLEDGARQRIEFFGQDQLPLSIVLLVDISPSVRPVIKKIREGALQALQHLKAEDEVALMVFCGWTELIQDFTKDRQLILDKVGVAMEKEGSGTRIHEAIAKAARQMRYATNPASRRVIIAVTDNQGSMDRYRDAISEEEVGQTVLESGATVCGVIVRSLLNVADAIIFQQPVIQERYKRTSVNPYVEQTGGEIAGASKDEINVRLGEVFDHLRSRYSIGYVSTNQNNDGKFRRIKVALSTEARKRLGGEIGVNARQGYYAVDRESEALMAEDKATMEKDGPGEARLPGKASQMPVITEKTGPAVASLDTGAPPPETRTAGVPVAELPPPPAPQPPEALNPYANLVMVDVQATNKSTGATVDNLAKDDFVVDDNGARAQILHFSRGELPLSVILLIDAGGKTPYVMSSLRRNIAHWLRELGPDDEVALMGFGASAALIQDFTKNRKLLAAGLRDFVDVARQKGVGYGQDRTSAVFQAAEYMDKAANPTSRRVIIAVTDDSARAYSVAESGATARLLLESRSVVYAMVTRGPRPPRKRQIVSAAAQGAIYGLGNPISIATQIITKLATEALLDAIMKDRAFGQMIQKTGGTAVRIDGEDATDKFASLLNRIRNRYVLGIAPAPAPPLLVPASNPAAQDGFHALKLKLSPGALKQHGESVLVTSQGYYARAPETLAQPDSPDKGGKNDEKKSN